MTHPHLTLALGQQIVAGIRAGGYPHVAAAAWGVRPEVFQRWLARGQQKHARRDFAWLAAQVRQAHAQARLRAEITLFENHPRTWLESGPGRDRPGEPGWSRPVNASALQVEQANMFLHPDILQVFEAVADALAPFPDARDCVTRILWPKTRGGKTKTIRPLPKPFDEETP